MKHHTIQEKRNAAITTLYRLCRYIEEVPEEEIERFFQGKNFYAQALLDGPIPLWSQEDPPAFPSFVKLSVSGQIYGT